MAKRANRFDQLIDQWDPVIRAAFRESVYNLRSAAQIEQIVRMLQAGNVEGALRAVGLDPTSLRPLDRAVARAFEAGGVATSQSLPTGVRDSEGLRVRFQFHVRNPEAERWLSAHSSTLIREILDDQRDMIRARLVDNLQRGTNPRTAALDLVGRIGESGRREGGVVGLTSSQERWVRNYERELASDKPTDALSRKLRDRRFDSIVRDHEEAGTPIPAELRERMVTAYNNRALRYRAESIARTEAMASLHEAQQQAMQQAVETGAISEDQVGFIWRTARDDRVRDAHAAMDGQEVKMGEMFTDGDGNQLEYPGDPSAPPETRINCRCWREPNVDFLRGVD